MKRINPSGTAGPLAVALLVVLLGTSAQAQDWQTTKLLRKCSQFILHPVTGDLYTLVPTEAAVEMYDTAALARGVNTPAATATVGPSPSGIAFKQVGERAYILVLCREDNTLRVLSPTLEEVASIALSLSRPSSLTLPENPDEAVVFYFGGDGRSNSKRMAVDLAAMKEVAAPPPPNTDPMLMADRVHPASTTTPAEFSRRRIFRPQYWVEPSGLYYVVGDELWRRDGKQLLATLPGPAVAAVPDQPVVLAVSGRSLLAISTNTFKTLGTVPLPEVIPSPYFPVPPMPVPGQRPAFVPPNTTDRDAPPATYLVSRKHNLVVAANRQHVATIPLDAFGYTPEQVLHVGIGRPTPMRIGERNELPLKLPADTAVSLQSGPEGLVLERGVLRWTPGDAQLGEHEVELRLTGGGAERVQKVPLKVVRPMVTLEFLLGGLMPMPDGKRVLAWSNVDGPQTPSNTTLVVIDIERLEVVARCHLPYAARSLATDGQRIFVSQKRESVVNILRASDLDFDQRLHLEHPVLSIHVVEGNLVLIQQLIARVFRCDDLSPVTTLTLAFQDDSMPPRLPIVETGVVLNGNVITSDFKGCALMRFRGDLGRWNRYSDGSKLTDHSGRVIVTLNESRAQALHRQHPILASVERVRSERGDSTSNQPHKLVLRDLVEGKPQVEVPMPAPEPRAPGIPPEDFYYSTVWAGDTALIGAGRQVHVYRLKPSDLSLFTPPMMIEPKQSAVVLDAGKPNVLHHTLNHAEREVQFSLHGETKGFTIDKFTGDVTVDGPTLAGTMSRFRIDDRAVLPAHELQPARSDAPMSRRRLFLEELLGRKFEDQVPVAIPVTVTARDDKGQTAGISYEVVLPVPWSILLEQTPYIGATPPPAEAP